MKHTISDMLKIIMKEKQLKQIDIVNLAKDYCDKYGVKIGRNDISQYVSGKVEPGTKKLLALAEALRTTPEYLMGWSEEEIIDEALMIDNDLLEKYGNILEAKEAQSERNNKLIRERLHSALEKFPPSYREQILDLTDINEIAKRLNVTVSWLMGEDSQEITVPSIGTPYNPVIHKIPILGRIAAGLPLYAEEHIEGYTYTEHNGGAEYFALRVKGDSMNAALINDGSLIIVRRQPEVENGQIAVVRVEKDDATVKRFRQDGDTVQLIPQSYNPTHQTQIYDLKNTNIEIIGKVVECKVEF